MRPLRRALQALEAFRQSMLFVPTLMTVAAIALFFVTSFVDTRYEDRIEGIDGSPGGGVASFLVFGGGSAAATGLLGSLVGTWATIVGVVYSVTILTVQLSATKYSAQVLPVFEGDRLNQVVLGSFTATFAYSLLVLKTVRASGPEEFVPIVGVNLAVVFALASLFLLLAFIGNLTAYIRPTRFVEGYADRGVRALDEERPPDAHEGYSVLQEPPPEKEGPALELAAPTGGYLVRLRWHHLRAAIEALPSPPERVELRARPGHHLFKGDALLRLYGAGDLDEAQREELLDAVDVSLRPTERHPGYMAETLGDIALTSMSGGSTDVGVAKSAIEGLLVLTAHAVAQTRIRDAYKLSLRSGRDVVLVVEEQRHDLVCFQNLHRILDKMAREGYTVIGESFAQHVAPVLVRAADAEDARVWEETMR